MNDATMEKNSSGAVATFLHGRRYESALGQQSQLLDTGTGAEGVCLMFLRIFLVGQHLSVIVFSYCMNFLDS